MSDIKLDLKDIQNIVEEGLKTTKSNWDAKRDADKQAFDAKVTSVLSEIEKKGYTSKEDVEKAVSEKTAELEKSVLALKKKGVAGGNNMGFKAAMAKALSENKHVFSDVTSLKGSNNIIELKDITYGGNFPGMDDWRQELRNDTIMIDRESFHMRDIIPLGSTSKEVIKYPREGAKTGAGPNSWGRGADIANTSKKPSFEPNFSAYQTNVEWVAGMMKLPIEMLADMPLLTSYLQSFAKLELLEAEDNQILNGNGTSPQLDGILPNSTAYDGTRLNLAEMIVDANLRQLGEVNTAGTDVLLNPANIVDIILNKASGSGEYNQPNGVVAWVNGQLKIAGLNVRKTNRIDENDFLLGNFKHAQLFQRMAPQLRFYEQDEDNISKNLVTMRIEERLALAILKTTSFVKGTYTPEP